jgi:hypothetical protein
LDGHTGSDKHRRSSEDLWRALDHRRLLDQCVRLPFQYRSNDPRSGIAFLGGVATRRA